MEIQALLIDKMIHFHANEPLLIQHFLKVYAFAKAIGELENIKEDVQYTLELAAITHDAGILVSRRKYGFSTHDYQELEGPPVAEEMLSALGVPAQVTKRVCFLIAHHHTWDQIDGIDYQILLEADFLVNAMEKKLSTDELKTPFDRLFKTAAGKSFFEKIFLTH